MLQKVQCDCGKINVVNITQKVIHDVTEPEKVFGFMGERLEVIESEIDPKNCKGCGKRLSVTL